MTESNHGGKRQGAGRKLGAPIVRRSLAIRVSDLAILNSIDDSPTLALRRLIAIYEDQSKRLEAMTAENKRLLAENTSLKAIKADRRNAAIKAMENIAPTPPVVEPVKRKSYGVGEFDPFEGE